MSDCRVKWVKKLGPDSLSSVWVHSVHFAKFLMLRFSKRYSSHSFHPIAAKLNGKYGNQWGIYWLLLFWWSAKFKHLQHFKDKITSATLQLVINFYHFGFIWQKVQQSGKAPGPLVNLNLIVPCPIVNASAKHLSSAKFNINIIDILKFNSLVSHHCGIWMTDTSNPKKKFHCISFIMINMLKMWINLFHSALLY